MQLLTRTALPPHSPAAGIRTALGPMNLTVCHFQTCLVDNGRGDEIPGG